jgi:hypothetical protein
MEAVLSLIPKEDRMVYSAMTGQSLFYMGETRLQHKILAISEDEGAEQASYALKLLQSEGEISIASTCKDPDTGQLTTKEYRVKGPVMIFITSTAIDLDEELLNRCLILTINESREQTERIHAWQRRRRSLAGLDDKRDREGLLTRWQNAQRLLKPLAVHNPYAEQLRFLSTQTRSRRDHEKYLTLIDSIALLYQYQRKLLQHTSPDGRESEYIVVQKEDILMANRLAHEVLGRSLDELPPQTRELVKKIHAMVQEQSQKEGVSASDYRFSRRKVREFTGWSNTALRIHCKRLEDMEYLLVHRGRRGQSFEYELLYDNTAGQSKHCMGLIDAAQLMHHDPDLTDQKRHYTPPKQPQNMPKTPPKQGGEIDAIPLSAGGLSEISPISEKNAVQVLKKQGVLPGGGGHDGGLTSPVQEGQYV